MLALLVAFGSAVCEPTPVGAAEDSPPVIDLHVDLSYQVNFRNKTLDRATGQERADLLKRAGVVGLVLPLFVPKSVSPEGPRASDLESSFDKLSALIPSTPPYALPGCAKTDRPVRTWLAFEGAAPLANDPGAVRRWVGRGARFFGLVHTTDNALAGSSGGPAGGPLTEPGRALVGAILDAGAMLDVSHASDAATDEMIALSEKRHVPIVATHSNARSLVPHPRNLTDEQLRRIGGTGGVIGVNFHSRFLTPRGPARLSDVVAHVLHIARVAGIDHVAIGSDFEGDITPAAGLRDVRGFPRLASALREQGLSSGDVEKIFSRNALRLLCP